MEHKADIENVQQVVETSASQTSIVSSGSFSKEPEPHFATITLERKSSALSGWWFKNRRSTQTCRYTLLQDRPQLLNNVKIGIGFLEFANALDFAANVWNESPLPRFVVALMAAGGSLTLLICIFAWLDLRLSWKNTRILRDERKYLHKLRALNDNEEHVTRDIDRLLGINFRELTSEVVDRVLMDVFLGFGGILVGVGTLIAIPGAGDDRIYLASNLLSGYIGNAFPLIWGVLNFSTSLYIWLRFHRQAKFAKKFGNSEPFQKDVILRCRQFQRHSSVTAVNSLIAGVAGMITFKYWWAYVILIPCIITSLVTNLYYRAKIGYDRNLTTNSPDLAAPPTLSLELTGVQAFCLSLRKHTLPTEIVGLGNTEKGDPAVLLTILQSNRLLPIFCGWLFNHAEDIGRHIFDSTDHSNRVVITGQRFANGQVDWGRLYNLFTTFLMEAGPRHFECRRRYLLELMAYDFEHYIAPRHRAQQTL
ncbi:hypothetical protein BGW36DRAFT_367063 [Talaromyces proteolyticus]|uniref:Integral membrane protein n=1 Tax=Talaromyces proteolyticus TaxID=1131652 RepID=A0AAD4L0C5_9EURO|nr:uncharacterized protein BGW36DRAFT_367063 [Talaromyces proteolyticus]KAH8705197.1 hypothetical protein BGW36DRAFT_367063 [Talaromyces proteolyticus]